jgi:hypothetical protein
MHPKTKLDQINRILKLKAINFHLLKNTVFNNSWKNFRRISKLIDENRRRARASLIVIKQDEECFIIGETKW